ncbi:GTP-binding protein [Oceanobacter sp. 3_MG-2023]|uniref:CobW family GTP-binding protein n=1 Tax=Oceanobacter sp. 3_MG-2023 TaxID=3062622 RepID=UPI002733B158|nr:GTP-binding protein [Oceanobacter sp. 3_MG-2023]MDP2504990.1 GTP-binding protein [Oceanobacter sp. 3_MG-2023]
MALPDTPATDQSCSASDKGDSGTTGSVSRAGTASRPPLPQVRVSVITGFLGTGKTTTILNLLQHRPAGEKWAVLVNEFGEVGVDGTILKTLGDGVVVREVPGGCLCCVSGLPFQIGMNSLISREKPDVLLIEPTGLGHPRQILKILSQSGYQDVLKVANTVTLVDPRHLSQPKYRQHEIYADQIAVADVLVANKIDVCQPEDLRLFDALVAERQLENPQLQAVRITQGQLSPDLLIAAGAETGASEASVTASNTTLRLPPVLDLTQPLQLEAGESFRALPHQGDGYHALGWLIAQPWLFSLAALRNWLYSLEIERAKAVLATDAGVVAFNLREGTLTEQMLGDASVIAFENRLELIDLNVLPQAALEAGWQACALSGMAS